MHNSLRRTIDLREMRDRLPWEIGRSGENRFTHLGLASSGSGIAAGMADLLRRRLAALAIPGKGSTSMKEAAFPSALRLMEEALILTKRVDAVTWLIYVAAAVPFFALLILGLTELTQNPFAWDELALLSLGLAVSYFWLHVGQSLFCSRLYAIEVEEPADMGMAMRNALAIQPLLAATKLIVWPIALTVLVPYVSVALFYQHALLPVPTSDTLWNSGLTAARSDARYKLGQGAWLFGLVLLFRMILGVNLFALLLLLPQSWKVFTGFENSITRWPSLVANPVAQCAVCSLVYLALDPIVKAACVLRRFERESAQSGMDLRLRLRQLQRTAAVVLIAITFLKPMAQAKESPNTQAPARSTAVSPEQMLAAVHSVFRDPGNTWNLPVVEKKKPPTNPFLAFIDSVGDHFNTGWKRFEAWLRDLFERANARQTKQSGHSQANSRDGWLVISSFSALLAALVLFAWFRSRRETDGEPIATQSAAAPQTEVRVEDMEADVRPQDEWMAIARQHRLMGNYRMSLRAMYLSQLSALAGAGLVSIAREKSNLDYWRELQRRGRRLSPEIAATFRSNLRLFEETWYGNSPVTEQTFEAFDGNWSSIQERLSEADSRSRGA